jgi:exo-beta-1,3-glucanase (GH17 family)
LGPGFDPRHLTLKAIVQQQLSDQIAIFLRIFYVKNVQYRLHKHALEKLSTAMGEATCRQFNIPSFNPNANGISKYSRVLAV